MKHPKSFDTDEATSRRMANVKLKGGKDEDAIAKALWRRGYRYWRNYRKLPGSPDVAIQKYHIAVFIDGEFWHGYDWENRKKRLKRNREYWIQKIEENMLRDKRTNERLKEIGWEPIHFWSKEIKSNLDGCVQKIVDLIDSKVK